MAQSWRMMVPGHPEHDLWGVVPLALPETWQHAVNDLLDGALAFSGLAPVLGYGALVLALPLLLLPTAFPELSRPRDALWSLVLAGLAPLLLLNRLPLFSSAGFGELIATVLTARLAAEVGQGRWGALTPDQRSALRHLPRWRRAGADLVAAVAQAAKAAWAATARTATTGWSATARTATAAWSAVSRQKGPVQEQRQDGQPAGKPVRKLVRKLVRKQWIRPDPSDGVQGDQDGEIKPGIPDTATEVGASSGPAVGNVSAAESAQPGAGGDSDPADIMGAAAEPVGVAPAPELLESPGEPSEAEPREPGVPPSEGEMVNANGHGPEPEPGETTPEEPDAPALVEEEAQSVANPDPADVTGAAAGPVDVAPAPEVLESPGESSEADPREPGVPPSEGAMVDADGHGPEPELGEATPEEPDAPALMEEEAHEEQSVANPDPADVTGAAAGPVDVAPAPEVLENPGEPSEAEPREPGVPPSEGAMVDAGGAAQEVVDASGTAPAQSAGDDSANLPQEEEDVVVRSFDDVERNWEIRST
ncbi:hypothetical protein [Candidatus Synechococcus spongiarum]|uniref:hypothetical protein n=1 Tax=Candidatus Synechococcus spongiarum TaxID=431041 RepID=UPI001267CF73|nr:hypothetical protein [Candidatus Synechococcus spongiarum]